MVGVGGLVDIHDDFLLVLRVPGQSEETQKPGIDPSKDSCLCRDVKIP